MPDILSHILFGEDVSKKIDKTLQSKIQNDKELFNLGTQGPDIFFYYRFLPWMDKGNIRKIGDILHTKKTGEFLIECLLYIKNNSLIKERFDDLLIYIIGFICHYALDKNTHPYIYYFSGVAPYHSDKYENYHKRLEIIIDSLLLEEKYGHSAYEYSVYKFIDLHNSLPSSLEKLYSYALKNVYEISLPQNTIEICCSDMVKAQKLLHDPYNIKKPSLHLIEALFKPKRKFSYNIYPRHINPNIDYLNKSHGTWCHPCCNTEIYTSSFNFLYDKAVTEAALMIDKSISYIHNQIQQEALKKVFQNVSYLTNKPCDADCIMKYSKNIFED